MKPIVTMEPKQTVRLSRGWRVQLNADEVFPDDPGMGTPALVIGPNNMTATWGCAIATGEVDCGDGVIPNEVLRLMEAIQDDVSDWEDHQFRLAAEKRCK